MKMSFGGGEIKGSTSPPPSKSHTHRAFFLAALAKGDSTIKNPLISDDTESTLNVCMAIGAKVAMTPDKRTVYITGGNLHAPRTAIDTRNSGTTMRISAGLLSIFKEKTEITGDSTLLKRPMGPLLDALAMQGVECTSHDGKPPVMVKGPNKGGRTEIDGSKSSQFITSLLMTAPMLDADSEIAVLGKSVSRPYLDVTVHMMKMFGADVETDGNTYRVRKKKYKPATYRVAADFSSAAFPLVAGALGGSVTVMDLDMDDPQGDRAIISILEKCGASVEIKGRHVTVGKGTLKAMDVDMGDMPDLFPIMAVLLSTAEGTSRLYGAPQLRFKESDRIESTVEMLRALGADADATDDGCIIRGKPGLKGGTVDNKGDHRIMMAAAVASIICDGHVTMDDAECYMISYPGFPEMMERLGMKVVR